MSFDFSGWFSGWTLDGMFDLIESTVGSYTFVIAGIIVVSITLLVVKALGEAVAGIAGKLKIFVGIAILAAVVIGFSKLSG
jgi:hypothetical protein